MNVSKHSWHYRLFNLYQNVWRRGPGVVLDGLDGDWHLRQYNVRLNLCKYFWIIVLSTIFAPLFMFVGLVGLVIVCIIIAPFYYGDKWIVQPYKERKRQKRRLAGLAPKPEKQPSLVGSFLKAKKSKVCPIITVVD